jgi:hypothetical protein
MKTVEVSSMDDLKVGDRVYHKSDIARRFLFVVSEAHGSGYVLVNCVISIDHVGLVHNAKFQRAEILKVIP